MIGRVRVIPAAVIGALLALAAGYVSEMHSYGRVGDLWRWVNDPVLWLLGIAVAVALVFLIRSPAAKS